MKKRFNTTLLDFHVIPVVRKFERRRNPYMLKMSKEINIVRMKHLSQWNDEDFHYQAEKKNKFKNIGLAVTEKKHFPESSVCEITFLPNLDLTKRSSPLHFLKNISSNRKSCIEGPRRRLEVSQEKIYNTKIVEVEAKDQIFAAKSVCSAYDCFRPTRLVRRKNSAKRNVNGRHKLLSQSPGAYNQCVSIQTDESPIHDSF